MLIGSRVVLCTNMGETTLVFAESSEEAFETACSKGRCRHNVCHFNTRFLIFLAQ